VTHDLFPVRILNRADTTFIDHSHDSHSALRRRSLLSTTAPSLRGDRGRRPGGARTGHARATFAARSGHEQRGGPGSCSGEAAAGRLQEARGGGGGESGGHRHGGRGRSSWAAVKLSGFLASLPGPFPPAPDDRVPLGLQIKLDVPHKSHPK
jgi:hypothetical protein